MSMSPVAVVMGSDSDLRVMRAAIDILNEFGLTPEVRILSAHRTPAAMLAWAAAAAGLGTRVIIAGAGGAAHLPGMIAGATPLPVIGVPVAVTALNGLDALLSIVQMPAGVPVATMAIDGGRNAGLFALRILAASDPTLRDAMAAYQAGLAEMVAGKDRAVRAEFGKPASDD